MHRHSAASSKLSRETDQRRALLRGLAASLVLEEKITTTKPKAKAVLPYFERLITRAKRNNLASRRQVLAQLPTEASVRKLYDELLPRFGERTSGFVSIKAAGWRRGDNAELATLSLKIEPAKKVEPKKALAPSKAKAAIAKETTQAKEKS